ncbi:MAG: hypothetical protein H0W72_12900 [Planctomycetes bacterium]|nr:hypothetical protein [Planctomycetota bacterium]
MSTTTSSSNEQLRQKAAEIKENVVDMAGIAKDMAVDKYTELKDGAASRYRSGVDKAGKARDGLVDYVKENPAKSLLACLCVGAIAGYLVSRRR